VIEVRVLLGFSGAPALSPMAGRGDTLPIMDVSAATALFHEPALRFPSEAVMDLLSVLGLTGQRTRVARTFEPAGV